MARLGLDGVLASGRDREAEYKQREFAEPAAKPCRECGEVKPAESFKRIPVGGRGHTCTECLAARKTQREKRQENSEELIIEELWSQYDQAENASERIRCLEALVKLRPSKGVDGAPKLSPEAVASLVKAMKAKRDAATKQ